MGEETKNYLHTDEDGDVIEVQYTSRWCMCCGNCYPDTIAVQDYTDKECFYELDIENSEIKGFIKELLEKGCVEIEKGKT